MDDVRPTSAGQTIPGWRVIVSDAGRYWASRREPFPDDATQGAALNVPPFRTVDADTLDELRAEVERQETAAAGRVNR
ncbi:hypothetical protein [Streptosporangium carneum]|uniref:Uncharacterized protein n=2 Tax=Streptosporangium carneum TaxID=47481 RepID=A0A9W6ICM7_9ACTN|nr:hypothetical protein GCM10017600_86610 [Streptosporangium carneum]